jgi:hypothetical protein
VKSSFHKIRIWSWDEQISLCRFIQNRLEYHKSGLMYKCINNSAPDYLCNLFDMNTNSNIYSLRSSAKGNLFVPRPNSNFMKRTFHYSGTILWNFLPPHLKLIQNIDLLFDVKTK